MKKYCIVFSIIIFFSASSKSQNLYFPPLSGDVWDSILPSTVGYCQPFIDSLYNYLQSKNTKSFIILKDGKRILEKYFGTYTKDSSFYWASASKSLASFITGVAQQKGFVNINNTVSSYIGNGWTIAPFGKESLIKVKNLLEMTSGLDDTPAFPCTNEDTAKACLQFKGDVNTRWSYHTGAYRKIQDVVSAAVGLSYNSITTNWIKSRIGMGGVWFKQVYYSKARDMARFGLLNLNKGIWGNDTLLKDSMYFNSMINSSQNLNNAYGYLWWLNGKTSFMAPQSQVVISGTLMVNAPNDMYCALGKDDQKIYIVPSQNIVIVRQGNSAGGFSLAASAFDNTLWDYINRLQCLTLVKENYESAILTIYPNPNNGSFIIKSLSAISSVLIRSIDGKLMFAKSINKEKQITVTNFEKGFYIVEILDQNNIKKIKKLHIF